MAKMTSCLELVNRIDEQDQSTLLSRLDELQAAGWEPDIAQAKAARHALAAIEAEARASAPVDQTQTEAFRKWFGDSKVVDADGRPLVVYHGSTRGGISHNTVQKSFFTSSMDVATTYSKDDYSGSIGESPTVQEMYLRIENPLEIDASGEPWMRIEFEGRRHTTDDLAALARRRGHDGLIVRNVEDNVSDEELPPSDIYVTLGGRSQIKSANNNDGQFDPTNPDIRRSTNRQTETEEFRAWSKGLPVYEDAVGVTGRGIYKVYHATRGDHNILKPGGSNPTLSGKAIWLSPHAEHQAAMHNIMSRDGFREGVNVMPLYARIERPLVIDDLTMLEWAREVFAGGSREFPQLMTDQAREEVLKEYDSIILDGQAIGWKGDTGEVIVFDSTQIKSAIGNDGSFDPANPDVRRSAERNPEGTEEFKAWSEGLPVIQPGDYEGGPGVFVAFHGTTHSDITQFRRIGNAEGFLGRGPYFTTEAADASENYAGVGPDLTSRIEQEKESLADGLDTYAQADMLRDYFDAEPAKLQAYIEDNEPGFTADTWEDDDANIDPLWDAFGDKALDLAATRALKGDSDGLMMKVYVKLTNPADTTGNQELEYNVETNDDGDIVDETGALVDWVLKAREIGERYGITREAEEHIDDVMSEAADGSVRMKDVFDSALKRFIGAYDDDGNMISPGQVFTDIAEELGYDGVIMDAGLHFGPGRRGFGGVKIPGMRGVRGDTLHIVPFTPNQVKSYTGNSGAFSLTDNDIRRSAERQTESPKFKRWFGDSKVVDAEGRPLVIYRGINTNNEAALNAEAREGYAAFGSSSPYVANSYANPDVTFGGEGSVMPLYIKADKLIEFPVRVDSYGSRKFDMFEFDRRAQSLPPGEVLVARQVIDIGPRANVGVDPKKLYSYYSDIYAWNRGTSVKSAIGNNGQFDLGNTDIRRSQSRMDAIGDIPLVNNYKVADLFRSSKKLNLWNKTVGTPYHLAQKYPEFKRVYDAIQRFIGDVSKYGTRAADMAPTILPKLETLKDVFRKPMPQEDVKALAGPIFEGTLNYTRDKDGNPVKTDDVGLAGVVWRPDELRTMWGLNDRQIGLYREFRQAANKSISDLAITDMLRYAGKDADPVREAALNAGTIARAQEIITSQLALVGVTEPKRAAAMGEAIAIIKEKGDAARGLIAKGYAPLSRYGDYTVYVVNGDEQIYFGMFETQREANRMARMMEEQHPDAEVRTGTMSKDGYKMFSGVTPETLALFGEAMGFEDSATDEQRAAFDKYLKLSKSNRSAMKRLIQRKGIDGYSEDFARVLAGFVYSNARQASVNLHAGEIGKSVLNIKESGPQNGDMLDYAVKLMQYVQNGQEEAQLVRGMLFTQYIGGSMASAITNLTQSFTTTWPTLSMHFGISKSAKAMASALDAVRKDGAGDADLKAAMKRAEEDGITAPQEVHQLMAQSQGKGSLQTGDGTKMGDALAATNNTLKKVGLVWGKAFGWAEQMNRRVAFAAAYTLAREKGMADPYAFAEKIVAETQYVMNKGNNPQWARGPVGATLFTFRKFMVNYLEGLARMWGNGPEGKKAFALSLAILWLMAGLGGFPGADDLDDLIDGFAQRVLNKNFSSAQAKREFFTEILGEAGAEFVMNGITGLPGAPIDVSGRLGLGNIVPGTGIFTKKTSYAQDIKEVVGAGGDFVSRVAAGAGMVAGGNLTGAAESFMPIAAANAYKAMQMAKLGYYKDMRNRKVVDTDLTDAVLKGIGFQPSGVFRVQEATRTQQQLIALNKIRETEIADLWTRGRVERNPDVVNEAKLQLQQWNRENPDSPISISESQINRRVKEAMMDKAKRIAKTAPKEIRADVKVRLQEQIGE